MPNQQPVYKYLTHCQEDVLSETVMMIPDTRSRLERGKEELLEYLVSLLLCGVAHNGDRGIRLRPPSLTPAGWLVRCLGWGLQEDPDVKALGEELEGLEAARAMIKDAETALGGGGGGEPAAES